MNSSIEVIPVTAEIKYEGMFGFWLDVKATDNRNNKDLGILNSHHYQGNSIPTDEIMYGVMEEVLEYEKLVPTAIYRIELTVIENGRKIDSKVHEFWGHTPPDIPPNWRLRYKEKIFKFLPFIDKNNEVIEDAKEYAARIKNSSLPNFPEEILMEWFHRQDNTIEEYSFLDFENLQFERETWDIKDIPGREAYRFESDFDHFIKEFNHWLATKAKDNWLAHYMYNHGTWNSPIILIENHDGELSFPNQDYLNQPYHLLEGHHRRSYLSRLNDLGKAKAKHDVFIARKIR
jgi:hypothetical protein